MPFKKESYQPNIDAGLGLIYRLNALWNRADAAALEGDLERWNFILDTIYRNLLYRNNLEIQYETDEKGKPLKVLSVDLIKEDKLIHEWYRKKIKAIKFKRYEAIKKKNRTAYFLALEDLYYIMGQKDSWLRKFMQERGLYLKEVEFNPANAMFGG
jgi:hypothetical protein